MRILLVNRTNLFEKFGGDSIKTLKTKEYLERKGVKVDLMLGNQKNINFNQYDLVHILNLRDIKLTPIIIKRAKKAKKPVVLSTIFWKSKKTAQYIYEIYKEYNPKYSLIINTLEKIIGEQKTLKIFSFLFKKRFFSKEKYILKNIDWILLESSSELKNIISYFNLPILEKKSTIITNGINKVFLLKEKGVNKQSKSLPKEFVLSVGRIDPIKNQINVIKALFDNKEIPLVFIGSAIRFPKYFKEFRKISKKRGNVYWFPKMEQEKLIDFYRQAKVYVQPSVWETFGLAILEAAIFDCNLVVTSEGGAKDYLQDKALYCQPNDLESIQKAILMAWDKNKRENQINLEAFTWEKTINNTIKIYEKVIS